MIRHNRPFPAVAVLLLLGCLVCIPGAPAYAAPQANGDSYFPFPDSVSTAQDSGKEWSALDQRITAIEEALGGEGRPDEQQLLLWQRETALLSESVAAYNQTLESELSRLNSELATLGEAGEDEPAAVRQQRERISERKAALEGKLAGYRLLHLRSETLHGRLSEYRQQVLTERFLTRTPATLSLLSEDPSLLWRWGTVSLRFLGQESGLERLSAWQLTALAVMIAAAIVGGGLLRNRCSRWSDERRGEGYRYAAMLFTALGHYAPHLLVGAVTALFSLLVFSSTPLPFAYYLGVSLPLFFLVWALLRFLFRGKGAVSALFDIAPQRATGLGRGLKLFALFAYVGGLIATAGVMQQMSEAGRLLARDLYTLLLVLSLFWAMKSLRPMMREHGMSGLFSVLLLLLLGSLAAEFSGYRNVSYWVLRASVGTGVLLFVAWLVSHLLGELFDGLRSGGLWWQRGLRRLFGYAEGEPVAWLGWIGVLAVFAVWLLFAYVAMLIWGISTETISGLLHYLVEGFKVGSLTVIPARIVVAVLVFIALLALSGWLRSRLDGKWLARSRMERGSREALVTISGYIGVAVAVLVALGVAGVKFTNLAIIAGALSVGIGFGLQNIVNNFVSGLILLFERPVKTGDWIMVGNTEGYVKRIRIRSTQIQTFDRADVIVPNSELISGQVTNWMLHDPRGRIRVPVGVAYGSDTQKVKEVLERIAAEHPSVITDGSTPEPKILFMNFGDSSLNFEVRAFIQNIDDRLQVASDLNFAIDAAFREEGIEIPFPQRDLHLRNWPPREEE